MLPGGSVALAAWFDRDRNRVVFTIADTGIGIAEKDIEKVMLSFGQAEGALSRRYQGIGLGLPLARRFVEAMAGGSPSRARCGTTITVDLPAQAGRPKARGGTGGAPIREIRAARGGWSAAQQ